MNIKGLAILFVFFVVWGGCHEPSDKNKKNETEIILKKVLVVYSHDEGFEGTKQVKEGLMEVLEENAIEVKSFYLNMRQNLASRYRVDIGQKALSLVYEYQPQVVVAVGDEAQEYFAKALCGDKKTAVVFCGVKAELKTYNYPCDNMTGVLFRPDFYKAMQFMLKLRPSVHTIRALSDVSVIGESYSNYLSENISYSGVLVDDVIASSSVDKWADAIVTNKSDMLMFLNFDEVYGANEIREQPEGLARWATNLCTIPTLGFSETAVERGCLLGLVESGYNQGQIAGQMTLKLLAGTSPQKIPVVVSKGDKFVINKTTADSLRISLDNLNFKIEKIYK
jgi:ABC-type uncharacterized transport system substrate-binding protein